MKNIKWTILITVAVLLLFSPCVNAEFVSEQKETLRGIGDGGIRVVIETIQPEIIKTGLTKERIRTDVELKLRMAGIKVLSSEEIYALGYTPYLSIVVYGYFPTYENSDDQYPYVALNSTIRMFREVILMPEAKLEACESLMKDVFKTLCNKQDGIIAEMCELEKRGLPHGPMLLLAGKRSCLAPIWYRGAMGLVSKSNLKEFMRNSIKDQVDEFLNDYLSVNPRQVDKPKKK